MIKLFLTLLLCLFPLIASAGDVLIDSYSEANQDGDVGQYSGSNEHSGQTITLGSNYTITKIKFYLKKLESPTGNMYAKIYASTGTVGSTATPTGNALATSPALDVSTLNTNYALITFTFSPGYAASAGDICILTEYVGGDASNYVCSGRDGSSPSHAGNFFRSENIPGNYNAYSTLDSIFYLYYTEAAAAQVIFISGD